MNLTDIIALAKAGYKPADVKELINLAEQTPEQTPPAQAQTTTEQAQTQTPPAQTPPAQTPPAQEQTPPDYKALYEQSLKDNEDLKTSLANAQSANRGAGTGAGTQLTPDQYLDQLFFG